jgi:hypothetical protein
MPNGTQIGRERADWVRNLMRNPHVTVELGSQVHEAEARRIDPDSAAADQLARDLLVAKYADAADDLGVGQTSLPIVIEFPQMQA